MFTEDWSEIERVLQRQHGPRISLMQPVQFEFPSSVENTKHTALCLNVSRRGMLLMTNEEMLVGEQLQVQFDPLRPGDRAQVAEVRWTHVPEDGIKGTFLVGIQLRGWQPYHQILDAFKAQNPPTVPSPSPATDSIL
jgi:PilZ domain-containing protein